MAGRGRLGTRPPGSPPRGSAPRTVTLSQLLSPSAPQFPHQHQDDESARCPVATSGADPSPWCLGLPVHTKPGPGNPCSPGSQVQKGCSNFPKFIRGPTGRTRPRTPYPGDHSPPPRGAAQGQDSRGSPPTPKRAQSLESRGDRGWGGTLRSGDGTSGLHGFCGRRRGSPNSRAAAPAGKQGASARVRAAAGRPAGGRGAPRSPGVAAVPVHGVAVRVGAGGVLGARGGWRPQQD